jgi:hypothetical protein
MSDSQDATDRNSQHCEDVESDDNGVSSGEYYYDDSTGYEPYDAEDDDGDGESIEKDS